MSKKLEQIKNKVKHTKADLTPLTEFEQSLQNLSLSDILQRKADGLIAFYNDHLKDNVTDKAKRILEPPLIVPSPNVPSLEETILM